MVYLGLVWDLRFQNPPGSGLGLVPVGQRVVDSNAEGIGGEGGSVPSNTFQVIKFF